MLSSYTTELGSRERGPLNMSASSTAVKVVCGEEQRRRRRPPPSVRRERKRIERERNLGEQQISCMTKIARARCLKKGRRICTAAGETIRFGSLPEKDGRTPSIANILHKSESPGKKGKRAEKMGGENEKKRSRSKRTKRIYKSR